MVEDKVQEDGEKKEEMSDKEKRIRSLTKLYYSNKAIQDLLLEFAQNREVVPRYFEGFGKRPDTLIYPSDIMGLVNRGATSFHASEEIWDDPLKINSDMSQDELTAIRRSWDLLIDIDSKYLDLSREAAKLVIEFLAAKGIGNYGLKFSGSKGFHIIVSGKAFGKEFEGINIPKCFPDVPRAIVGYIFSQITPEFRKRAGKLMSFSSLEKDDQIRVCCKKCQKIALQGAIVKLRCPICGLEMERRDMKETKRRLRCLNKGCAGVLDTIESKKYYFCEDCKDIDNEKFPLSSNKYPEMFEEIRGEFADEHAELDMVLVAPRHLFRMPYSLHEKTSLASVVLRVEELEGFGPRDADPMKIRIRPYYPSFEEDEGKRLLSEAWRWKMMKESENEKKNSMTVKKYEKFESDIELKDVPEEIFPPSIKRLLKGLKDGRKRGLFILITFLRSLNYSPEYINDKVRNWNRLNDPPLKEGYIKSQIEWHLKQKKKIMPPNYDNPSFYKDLGLLDKKPDVKNPIVDVLRAYRRING